MIYALVILTALCLIGIMFGRLIPGGQWLGLIGGAVLLYLASLIAWWFALYFQLVPLDRALARLNIYRTEGALGALIYFGPPLLPVVAFLLVYARTVWGAGR